MSRERSIGSMSSQQYTKSEFIKLIDCNFPDNETGSIAVVVTTSYGDYDQPTIMQGITFGKILNDNVLYGSDANL